MRKQKFLHEKTADGGTEGGGTQEDGAKDRRKQSRHTRKVRTRNTKPDQQRAGEDYGGDNQTFPDKATEKLSAQSLYLWNRHIIYSIILVLPYILSAKQRTYRFPVKAEETGNLRNSHLKISTHMSNQQTFFP